MAAQQGGSNKLGLLGIDLGERENEFDNNGWAHIHHAAFNGYQKSVLRFVNTKPDRLEILTDDEQDLTPLLVACISGQQESVETLLELGANVKATDRKMRGVVELSSVNGNTHLLEYFIDNDKGINVFEMLYKCLSGNDGGDLELAACHSLLALSNNNLYCDNIVQSNGIKALFKYLNSSFASEASKDICLDIILSVLDVILIQDQILENKGLEILVANLSNKSLSTSFKAVKILGILAAYAGQEIKHKFEELNGLVSLVELLKNGKDDIDLSLECLNTLIILITDDPKMQNSFNVQAEGLSLLNDIINKAVNDPQFHISAIKTLVAVVSSNRTTQIAFAELDNFVGLINLLKSKSNECVVNTVIAIQSLTYNNEQNQELFIKHGAINLLSRILKRSRQIEAKSATASALWAIAGEKFHQRRAIATFMGVSTCVEFLGSSVPSKLNFYGSEALQTLTKGVGKEIEEIANAGGVQRILHIIANANTPSYVAVSMLQSLRALCIAPGYFPHLANQKTSIAEGAPRIILNFARNAATEAEQAESYYSLGAVAYGNRDSMSSILNTSDFSYIEILRLLYSSSNYVKEISGSALALFAFNNRKQLKGIAYSGGIPYQHFVPFLTSEDKSCVAYTAFQIAVLSKIIPDETPALSSATGIKILVDLLNNDNEEIQALSGNLLCGLANLKSGVPNAIISIGTIKKLCKLLISQFDIVQASAAVTLCQLSQQPEGQRQLLNACRLDPYLFKVLQKFPHRIKLPKEFLKRWKHNKDIGLPPIR